MSNNKAVTVGCALIALAVLAVLGCVLVPIWSARGDVKDILRAACSDDPQYVLVSDPLFETGDPTGNDGKEVKLDADAQSQLRSLLETLAAGYSYREQQRMPLGAWDLSLSVKTAAGDMARLYFTDAYFYYTDGERSVRFAADDSEAYAALLTLLQEALQ